MAESVDDMRKRALTREDLLLNPSSPYGNLQQVLGTTVCDVGTICLNDNINMMSKCKPIKYDTAQELTSFQRIGMASENSQGYYYGVKIALDGTSFKNIHTCKPEYSRPTGLPYYFRLTDFIGYHHLATANMDAIIQVDKIYIDVEYQLRTFYTVDHLKVNDTGIDLMSAVIKLVTNSQTGSAEEAFSKCWPFIAIDDKMCIMKNELEDAYTPIYNGAWWDGFVANLNGAGFGTGEHTVTLGFMIGSNNTAAAYFPKDGTWVTIGGVSAAEYMDNLIVAPSSVGLAKTFSRYNSLAPTFTPSVSANRMGVIIIPTYTEEPTAQCTLTVSFTTGGMTVTKTETFEVSSAMHTINITWRELGMTYMSGMMLTYSCYIISKYANSSAQTVGPEVSETITVQ